MYYILPKQPLDLIKCSDLIIKTFRTNEEPILVIYDVSYHHLRGKNINYDIHTYYLFCIIYLTTFNLDQLAESLASLKSIILSDLNLPEHITTKNTSNISDNEFTNIFGRQFCNLNYKYIVYLIHDNYMNNVDRFILEKKGKNIFI